MVLELCVIPDVETFNRGVPILAEGIEKRSAQAQHQS
jgi:hypothetical protein